MVDINANMPDPPCSPIQFHTEPQQIASHCEQWTARLVAIVDQICQRTENHTFDNTILPFIEWEKIGLREQRVLGFYATSSANSALRDESRKASKTMEKIEGDLFQEKEFYAAFCAVQKEKELLDPEYQFYMNRLRENFEKNGLTIVDKEKQARFFEISKDLKELISEAMANHDADTTGTWFTRQQLDGLPASYFEARVTKEQDEAVGKVDPKYWVTAKEPDLLPIKKFATSPETRKHASILKGQRAPGNIDLYPRIFALRDEAAKLLRHRNHAALETHYKTTKSPENVLSMLDNLQKKFTPKMQDLRTKYLALKKVDPQTECLSPEERSTIYAWDQAYYDRIMTDADKGYRQEDLMEYFPLDHIIAEHFKTFQRLFSIRIERYQPRLNETWHPEVSMYTVWDAQNSTNSFIGWLYIDPYPRTGKYQHFGHYALNPGSIGPTGARLHPASVIMMNMQSPSTTTPSLLIHRHVQRLFHELGHAMHSLLSLTKTAALHMPSWDRDFTEAIGMMFESFLSSPKHMRAISCHYSYLNEDYKAAWLASHHGKTQPERQIPIKWLEGDGGKHDVFNQLTRIWHAKFDMAIHMPETPESLHHENLVRFFTESHSAITGLANLTLSPTPPSGNGGQNIDRWGYEHAYTGFRAIVAGYGAGYYTYMLSQVIAHDLFDVGFAGFVGGGEKDSKEVGGGENRATGMRFRELVLGVGGRQAPADTLKSFLGREVSGNAFGREYGV
ncbi:zincin [Microthyrium microscopicum]|uniref:Zincin n=1 Tax=Microthyrium microscopicum TaxID=703497 RepID=A0A6A6TXY1_9PEZI|nr:zincin [Microthyrium microscopicum]